MSFNLVTNEEGGEPRFSKKCYFRIRIRWKKLEVFVGHKLVVSVKLGWRAASFVKAVLLHESISKSQEIFGIQILPTEPN